MIDRRTCVRLGLAAALLPLVSSCSRTSVPALRAVDNQPDGYPTVEAIKFFAKRLEEKSNSELRTTLYTGGQLGQEKDTLEITIFGGLDFNRINMAPLNSIEPLTSVPNLPFMFRSIGHMRAAMDGAPGQAVLDSLRPHGLVGLCFYDSGARSFYTTGRPIETLSDLAGLKIRVQNSDLYVSMVEALGGDATPMAFGEVYQGLLQGVIDGAENNWPSYQTTRHFEAAKYYSLTRHVMAPEVLVMSKRRWEKLPFEYQGLIRSCAWESVPVMRNLWDKRVKTSREMVLSSGVIVTEPDIQPFQDKVQDVWRRYLKTDQMRQLANQIQEVRG